MNLNARSTPGCLSLKLRREKWTSIFSDPCGFWNNVITLTDTSSEERALSPVPYFGTRRSLTLDTSENIMFSTVTARSHIVNHWVFQLRSGPSVPSNIREDWQRAGDTKKTFSSMTHCSCTVLSAIGCWFLSRIVSCFRLYL